MAGGRGSRAEMSASRPQADGVLLAAEDIVAGYLPGVDVLNGCTLALASGELVGVIGPNGAGKSTLLKAIFGLLPVRGGRVMLRGVAITGQSAHALVSQGVGYVPQSRNVFATLTVEENLEMGTYLRPRQFTRQFAEVTDLFPLLAARRRQKAGSLSGGERQMLAMGRALMMGPSVLLLDEPSAGLSPANTDDVFDRIRLVSEAGVSIVMVEQNARRCLQIADRGYVLDQGRNARTGTGRNLLDDPQVIECYLGTLARVD
jgi:branched-chain amino acid transport system ATP-binding protein